MTDTKRVDELKVGDNVIFPGCKGSSTINHVEKVGFREYRIICQGIRQAFFYYDNIEVTYLGNNKPEKIMEAKVDCSALYPYFDNLISKESSFHVLDLPSCLKKELVSIHDLFEGVIDLTLEEVKTLYFERKMSQQKSEIKEVVESKSRTKKAKDLQPGDKTKSVFEGKVLTVSSVKECLYLEMRYEELAGYSYCLPDTEYKLID